MGPEQPEQPPVGVKATYDEEDKEGVPDFVQVYQPDGQEPIIPLSRLIPTMTPSEIPKLIYEPQRIGEPPHNFGFVYEHDGTNRCALREGDKTFMDLFAGSGGYHQGVMQAGGFKGVAAVEYWDKACETFSHNHPETPIYEMKVEQFLEENGPSPVEFCMKRKLIQAIKLSKQFLFFVPFARLTINVFSPLHSSRRKSSRSYMLTPLPKLQWLKPEC